MYKMIKLMLLAVLLASTGVWAADLKSAKAEGWIGEQSDGYLGLVKAGAPADVQALLAEVNGQRQAHFGQIASKTGVSPAEAATVFAKEAAERTESGNYIQHAGGGWVRK